MPEIPGSSGATALLPRGSAQRCGRWLGLSAQAAPAPVVEVPLLDRSVRPVQGAVPLPSTQHRSGEPSFRLSMFGRQLGLRFVPLFNT